jgi:hypothetical protein
MITIDGIDYDIPVVSIERNAEFLDKFAERTEDGVLHRELIGVYFNYTISFGRTTDTVEYAALWQKLTEATEFHEVTVPDESGDFTFVAYFTNVKDKLRKQANAQNFFIAQEPANV